jgi:hypothetical protein
MRRLLPRRIADRDRVSRQDSAHLVGGHGCAERDERLAVDSQDQSERDALLLKAFSEYAAAAMHAYREDWPDSAWKHWRYRRASLARVLAANGMMQPVADSFAETLAR